MGLLKSILKLFGLSDKDNQQLFHDQKIHDQTQIAVHEIEVLMSKGDLNQAKNIIDRERKISPDNPAIRFLYARWLKTKNRYAEAATILEGLTTKYALPEYFLEYAHVLFQQGDLKRAEKYCQQILEKDQNNQETLILLAKVLLSRIAPEEEDRQAKTIRTDLKDLYAMQTENFDQIITLIPALKKLVNENPKDQIAIETLAEIYAITGDRMNLKKLLEMHDSEFIAGKIELINGQYTEAAEIFKNLVKTDENNIQRLQNYAIAEEKSGNLKEASRLFQKILLLAPQNLFASRHFLHLAIIIDDPEITAEFERSVKDENRGELFALYAVILEQKKEYEKAMNYYAKALDAQTANKSILYNFANLTSKILPHKDALITLEKLTKKYPDDQELLDIYLSKVKSSDN